MSIRDSVKRLLDDEIGRLGLGGFYGSTEGRDTGSNGQSFYLFGSQELAIKDQVHTKALTHCWIEEAETVSERSLDLLMPTNAGAGFRDMDEF
jgi:phage terminase large subunit